jgi:hypothetical protein
LHAEGKSGSNPEPMVTQPTLMWRLAFRPPPRLARAVERCLI